MDFTQVGTVVTITVVCYLIGMLCKAVEFFKDEWIPVIMGIFGAILGVAAWLSTPSFPADDWLSAVAVGIVSGLAATGTNQIWKQLSNKGDGSIAD